MMQTDMTWDHPHPWKVSFYPSVFFFTPKEIHGDLKPRPKKKECAQQKKMVEVKVAEGCEKSFFWSFQGPLKTIHFFRGFCY